MVECFVVTIDELDLQLVKTTIRAMPVEDGDRVERHVGHRVLVLGDADAGAPRSERRHRFELPQPQVRDEQRTQGLRRTGRTAELLELRAGRRVAWQLELPARDAVLEAAAQGDARANEGAPRRVVVRRGEDPRLERLARQRREREPRAWIELQLPFERVPHGPSMLDAPALLPGRQHGPENPLFLLRAGLRLAPRQLPPGPHLHDAAGGSGSDGMCDRFCVGLRSRDGPATWWTPTLPVCADLADHSHMAAFAVVAHRVTPTNTRLGMVLTPAQALSRLVAGDVALGRLDVLPTLDGVEPGLWALDRLAALGVNVLNGPRALV